MDTIPIIGKINETESVLVSKIKLTKNEYNATIRNRFEHNRLELIQKHINDQNSINACKFRTSMHNLRKNFNDNQKVICNSNEFFMNRKIQSASPHCRSRLTGVRSSFAHSNTDKFQNRAKSASTISRAYTAPLQTLYEQQTDTESDDEIIPISMFQLNSGKHLIDRSPSAISSSTISQQPLELNVNHDEPTTSITNQRITWPVNLKVSSLQDENEARNQFLAWRAEQRKVKVRRSSKQFFDSELDKKYQESIRRRHDIEAYLTPQLIEEHKTNDPIFAKRYQQLKVAVRSGKLPSYDPHDCEINFKLTKSKIERSRTALMTAEQTKLKTFYRNQQNIYNKNLTKRIENFLKRIAQLKEEQEQQTNKYQ